MPAVISFLLLLMMKYCLGGMVFVMAVQLQNFGYSCSNLRSTLMQVILPAVACSPAGSLSRDVV
jgi:hypothetical protein